MSAAINNSAMIARQLPLKTTALILAGGRGSRLKNLTNMRAKPAVHFGGKFRIIDFALSNCINSGIRRIGVITQYQSHSLVQHLQKGWSIFNEEMNEFLDLLPAQQRYSSGQWYVGTADAVLQNLDIIRRYNAEYILILAGDHIYKQDYSRMLLDHHEKGALCTIACIPVAVSEASAFGVMTVAPDDKITDFTEKPSRPATISSDPSKSLVSMGIYIFTASYLYELLQKDAEDADSEHDFGKNIIPKIVAEGNAWAHPFTRSCVTSGNDSNAYWKDVGTIDAYWRANLDLASPKPELDVYDPDWPIHTYVESLPCAKFIHNNSQSYGAMMNSLVSGGCIIADSIITNSLLFSRVNIKPGSLIDSCVLLPGVTVGKHCRLHNCVIDKNCVVPDNTVIGEDFLNDRELYHRTDEGIVLVTKEMLINVSKRGKQENCGTGTNTK